MKERKEIKINNVGLDTVVMENGQEADILFQLFQFTYLNVHYRAVNIP